jgi:hypothetical protein
MSLPGIITQFSKVPRPYTGVELRPHFLLTELGLKGSALGAFIGPCQVKTEHLVDWEDRLAQDRIEAKLMIHFIGEFFGAPLREGVLRQRLLMAQIGQAVSEALASEGRPEPVRREGDDLFVRERKLSVSIVTASPVSQLLHVGINIDPSGAPVPAIGLAELGLDPEAFVACVLEAFSEEWSGVEWACAKVRPVV